jgi:hypothetical protein
MIYPNNPLYLLSLLGYIYYLTYYTLTTKDNIEIPPKNPLYLNTSIAECHVKYNIYDFLPCPNSALISVQQLLISLPQ